MQKDNRFIDIIQGIGGFLILMFIPLFIGLIWFDTITMLKLIATNSLLIFGIWIMDNAYKK